MWLVGLKSSARKSKHATVPTHGCVNVRVGVDSCHRVDAVDVGGGEAKRARQVRESTAKACHRSLEITPLRGCGTNRKTQLLFRRDRVKGLGHQKECWHFRWQYAQFPRENLT
jgi:hypothetical protein